MSQFLTDEQFDAVVAPLAASTVIAAIALMCDDAPLRERDFASLADWPDGERENFVSGATAALNDVIEWAQHVKAVLPE